MRDGRLFGQILVGVWLLAKTVISRASLTLCFISVRSAVSPFARAPARGIKERAVRLVLGCGCSPKP